MYAPTKAVTFFFCSIGLAGALGAASARAGFQQGPGPNGEIKLSCDEQPCDAEARGRVAFNRRELGGNGRACADCHMPSEGFQLSPAAARARFERLLAQQADNRHADDPLFRPVDADDFRVNGDNASDYSNLVENGLVRVTMPLPANVRLIDPATGQPSDETFVDLWRAVMPVVDVAITGPDGVAPIYPPDAASRVSIMGQDPFGPNRQGGYQHDARFGTLQEQARGALIAHAQVSTEPPVRLLDDLAAFQQTLFSSTRVEALAEAIRTGGPFPDPDPELDGLEQQGKVVFTRACAQCHGGPLHPSTTTSDAALPGIRPVQRYPPNLTACPRPATDGFSPCPPRLARNARIYRITRADGTFQFVTTSDPGRLLLTGQPADLGIMDVTNLRGISRTAPYFHNNSAATLEEMLDHYDAFFRSVSRRNPPPNLPPIISSNGRDLDRGFVRADERAALLAYLRKL